MPDRKAEKGTAVSVQIHVHGLEPLPTTVLQQSGRVQDHEPACDRSIVAHPRCKTAQRPLKTPVLGETGFTSYTSSTPPHTFAGKNPSPVQKGKSYCLKRGFLQIFNKGAHIFWTNLIPDTIFIKVHLSAVSLPKKQLSIKNSACCLLSYFLLFFCLWSGFCVIICTVSCLSCRGGMGAEASGCWLSA